MVIFGTDGTSLRGCFTVFTYDTSPSRGTVLELPRNGQRYTMPPPSWVTFPLIVTSVDITQMERIFYLKCFNNRVYSYTFGNDIGSIRINYLGFLASGTQSNTRESGIGGPGGEESKAAKGFLRLYERSRASISRELATLSFGGVGPGKVSLRGLVRGMTSTTSNVETNIQGFTFNLDVIEAQRV